MCAASEDEPEDPLIVEQDRLVHARRCLEQMREAVRALDAQGGDPVSTEFLKAELFRRAQALLDDPTTPLFFGRIDRTDTGERFYIGRRHIRDDRGDPVVVDWRADISRAFYRASAATPMSVGLRRRFGFNAGVMTSFEDEHLDRGEARDPAHSGILTAEIERPRVGPMRDIVATIQPDQDDLVRTDLATSVCIQGAPGTGKTAVGLHRAAYLLYAYREQLRRSRVLVIGPNTSFLGYIGALLPALGEIDVEQLAVADLAPVAVRGHDEADVDRLKGDERMAEVVRRAVYSAVATATGDIAITVHGRRWRISTTTVDELVDRELASGAPYDVTRARLATLLAEVVRRRVEAAGGSPDDRAVGAIARSAPLRAAVDAVWPPVSARSTVMRLLTDETFLRRCADGLLDPGEQRLLLRPAGTARSSRWSVADGFLVDEAAGLLARPRSYGHVVVDEAQDLSAMQCRAVGRRCPTGSVTVLGDLAQATAPAAPGRWERTLELMGQPGARLVPLTRGYRVPAQVLDFANRLLAAIDAPVSPATSIRHGADALHVVSGTELTATAVDTVTALLARDGSIGVISTDAVLRPVASALRRLGVDAAPVDTGMDARVTLVPVTLCKGLEFDQVVVIEPARIAELPRGLNWLYVALTRAVSSLSVVHHGPLPRQLSEDTDGVDSTYAVAG